MSAREQIAATFADVGVAGFLHARALGTDTDTGTDIELGIDADTQVVTASVIKIVFALAFFREVAAGRIDPRERVEVPAQLRLGGPGTTGFADPPLVSLRDLALSMLTVSDNAATDIVYARAGRAAIDAVLADLELRATHVRSDMTSAHRRVVEQLGFPDERDLDARLARADPDAVRALAWLDPVHANASTPRETTALLEAIWSDRAGPPQACASVREAMAQQVSTGRLASGFGPEMTIAAKTGTLPGIRNEAGVVTTPDDRGFAVAVFTRGGSLAEREPRVDAAIGRAARLAVDELARGAVRSGA
jgi:beta-lactamase class A